jgi:hypothetical protein
MAADAVHAARRRPWFRYRLRTVFVVVAVLCVVLGRYVRERRDQRAAIAAVQRLGGAFLLADQYAGAKLRGLVGRQVPQFDVVRASALPYGDTAPKAQPTSAGQPATPAATTALPPGPAWARRLFGEYFFANVAAIRLPYYPAEDIDARNLSRLSTLKELVLSGTRIDDEDLRHLGRLDGLESLYIADANITDDGLAHVGRMRSLVDLVISGNVISDRGLTHLRGLTKLERLTMVDTRATSAGIDDLRRALPNCKVVW